MARASIQRPRKKKCCQPDQSHRRLKRPRRRLLSTPPVLALVPECCQQPWQREPEKRDSSSIEKHLHRLRALSPGHVRRPWTEGSLDCKCLSCSFLFGKCAARMLGPAHEASFELLGYVRAYGDVLPNLVGAFERAQIDKVGARQ